MESPMTRTSDPTHIPLLDDAGQVIGVITSPVAAEVTGPGREKVYLARPSGRQAVRQADRGPGARTPHAA